MATDEFSTLGPFDIFVVNALYFLDTQLRDKLKELLLIPKERRTLPNIQVVGIDTVLPGLFT